MIRQALRSIRSINALAAPASTLLWWCLGAVVALTTLRAAGAATPKPPRLEVEGRAQAGGQVTLRVRAPESPALAAYLPGLDLRRVRLTYDPDAGQHVGRLRLPARTPPRGFFTVRLLGDGERDVRVRLIASLTAPFGSPPRAPSGCGSPPTASSPASF